MQRPTPAALTHVRAVGYVQATVSGRPPPELTAGTPLRQRFLVAVTGLIIVLAAAWLALIIITRIDELFFPGQGIPYPGGVPLFLPFAALLLPATVLLRIASKGVSSLVIGDTVFMTIRVLVLLTYIYGIVLSTDFPGEVLFRDVFTGVVAMSIVFAVGNSSWDREARNRLVMTFAWTFLAIGSFVGVLGAYKFG